MAYGGSPSIVDNLGDETAAGDAIRNLTEQHDLVVADITVFGALLPIAEENPTPPTSSRRDSSHRATCPTRLRLRHGLRLGHLPDGRHRRNTLEVRQDRLHHRPDVPDRAHRLAGYTQGAQSVNPDIEVVETVVSSYSDVPGTQQAATAQIASGVDVLYGFVDAGFVGLQQAADEAAGEVLLFSPVVDRCDRGDNIVGNNVSDIPAMTTAAIGDFANGTLPPRTQAYGLEDESIQFFNLCSGYQDADLVALATDTVAAIKDGSLQLPSEVTAR